MSEEEKKAIERFKANANYCITSKETTQTILNLIEKQQKEIEDLKDFISKLQATKDRLDAYDKENTFKIEKQQKEIEELNELLESKTTRIAFENIDNFVSKDKIREKIKDLNKKSSNYELNYSEYYYKMEILKELLEEK